MGYNKEQLEAINKVDGTVLVISAAGSGKSTVLIERISNMINNHGIKEEDILAISFTNASAEDLKKKLKEKGIEGVTVGTLHSVCKSILEQYGYDNLFNSPNIYQVKREIENVTGEKNINIDDIMSWIGYQKNYMLSSTSSTFKEKESLYTTNILRKAFNTYERYCKKNKCYDFDDWLLLANKLYEDGKSNKHWKYVACDEVQDFSMCQHTLANNLCDENNNLFCVGDFFQSIYSWRGASPDLFKEFDKTHNNTKVINMNTNYRSCNNIVEVANEFIRPYGSDYEHYKDTIANNKTNGIIECHMYPMRNVEAFNVANKIEDLLKQGIDKNEIAVIYRNNSHADCIENELKHRKIDYTITNNGSFFERKEIKGILAVLRLVNDITDDEAFEILFKECRFYPTTYYQGILVDNLKTEAGKKNCTLYEAFIDHRFAKPFEKRNCDIFVDYINRLKIQKEKHLGVGKMIDNIVRMFKVKEWIGEKYESSMIQDKIESINNLKSFTENNTLEGFIGYCMSGGGMIKRKNKDGIRLHSIHASKGLEYQVVFLIGLEEGKFPSSRDSEDAEARLMYVGCTRSKEQFYLSSIGYSDFYDKYKKGLDKIKQI